MMTKENITLDDIEQERKIRIIDCHKTITQILVEYDCILVSKAIINDDGRIASTIYIESNK